jgi:hypothetical protein
LMKGEMKLVRYYNEVEIVQRDDGYLNATAMCQACGKLWGHYAENISTAEFVQALSVDIGIPISKLIVTRKGGTKAGQGTWVHPQVAMHLAQWLDPRFAAQCSRWIIERLQEEADPDLALRRGKERAADGYRRMGYSEAWISERVNGKEIRKEYTDELKRHGCEASGYGQCTNAIYEHVFGAPCSTLKTLRGLDERDNLRDKFNRRELTFTRFAEELAVMKLDQDDARGNAECIAASAKAGRLTREAVNNMMGVGR